MVDMEAWQHHQAIPPATRRVRQKARGWANSEVREKLQALRLHRELEAGLGLPATNTVASCIREWRDDGLTTRQASTRRELPASCRSWDRPVRRGQAQGPDGPAGAKGPGRAAGTTVGSLAAAACAQRQASKIARPRETAPLAAGR